MHTTYTFKKNGKAYSAKANNRFEAQEQIELAFGISLKGATFEEVYKLRVVRTGKKKKKKENGGQRDDDRKSNENLQTPEPYHTRGH